MKNNLVDIHVLELSNPIFWILLAITEILNCQLNHYYLNVSEQRESCSLAEDVCSPPQGRETEHFQEYCQEYTILLFIMTNTN